MRGLSVVEIKKIIIEHRGDLEAGHRGHMSRHSARTLLNQVPFMFNCSDQVRLFEPDRMSQLGPPLAAWPFAHLAELGHAANTVVVT
ncbi:hypothetical protein [Streptomyces echinatus]|uniref:hypothetical protein n=1 Tax=Streptomyces echinatus TaxID=67293 RepID=UPI0031E635C3